jgi:hypothetical protein
MSASLRLLAVLALGAGCSQAAPSQTSPPATDFEPRASYPRTLQVPEGCEWPLELEQLVCAIEHEVAQPTLDRGRRACVERHLAPIRKELASYAKSFNRLEEIRSQRSRPLAMRSRPPGLGPDPTRNPEEPLGTRGSDELQAEREQRAEIKRQQEELVLRDVNARSESKLSEIFRYVEPCLDARIPFKAAAPALPPGTKPPSSGAEEML